MTCLASSQECRTFPKLLAIPALGADPPCQNQSCFRLVWKRLVQKRDGRILHFRRAIETVTGASACAHTHTHIQAHTHILDPLYGNVQQPPSPPRPSPQSHSPSVKA
jgi:hypothetical protein